MQLHRSGSARRPRSSRSTVIGGPDTDVFGGVNGPGAGVRQLLAPLGILAGLIVAPALAGSAPLLASPSVTQQTDVAAKPPAEGVSDAEQPQPEIGIVKLAPPSSGTHSGGPFPIDWEHLRFLRGSGDVITVWAAINVDAGRCQPRPASGGWLYSLAMQYELYDQNGERVATGTDELRYVHPSRLKSDQGFGLQAPVTVPPGTYWFRIEVRDRNREPVATNVKEGELIVPSYEVPGPVLSDLAVASDTPGIWQPLPGIRLKLNASHVVHVDASPYIYFEAYGLTPGARYRVEVQMQSAESQSFMDRRLRGAHRPFQLQYSGPVPIDPDTPVRGAQHLKLGTNTLPGLYQVTVKITDLTTGETSLPRRINLQVRSREFQVREPSARLGAGAG